MTDFPFDDGRGRSPVDVVPPGDCDAAGCTVEPLSDGEPLIRHTDACPTIERVEALLADLDAAEEAIETPTTAAVVIATETSDVLSYRDPAQVAAAARAVRELVVGHIRDVAVDLRARRESVQGDKRATVGDLSAELRTLADVRDAISALADALAAGRDEAEGVLGELVEETGKRSSRLSDGRGLELLVSLEQRRDLSVDTAKIVGVVRGSLAYGFDETPSPWAVNDAVTIEQIEANRRDAYLSGVDDGIAALRELLSSTPTFRTTALDAFVKRLAGYDDGRARLAAELERAYARVPKGEPRVTVARLEPKAAKS